MQTIPIHCLCGAEIDRVSTNVLGLSATIKCPQCGRNNEFKRSLRPEGANDGHPNPVESQPIHTQGARSAD